MTNTPIYQWKDDYFCDGDIIGALIEDSPWSGWVDLGHDPDEYGVEETLDNIAHFFNLSRRDTPSLIANNFPVVVNNPPEPPAFCRMCMRWFS